MQMQITQKRLKWSRKKIKNDFKIAKIYIHIYFKTDSKLSKLPI